MSLQPLPEFLSPVERGIYEQGVRDLMAAILEARRGGWHGAVSLVCGMDPRLRDAEVVRAQRRKVIQIAVSVERA